MSRKRRSTNAERKAKAKRKMDADKREERREEYRTLEGKLHCEWPERNADDLMSGSGESRDIG